jgi:nitrite reductase/ring-hydroxylating ferredoxin subunit/uncharacterized membrane protein
LNRLTEFLEHIETLDGVVEAIRGLGQRILRSDRLTDLLSGTVLGHPAHPVLVDLPIGFWTGSIVLDLAGQGQHRAARRLVGLGVISSLPAVATGWSDWVDTDGAESRIGLVHAASNATALGCFTASWLSRRQGGSAGLGWSLAGTAALTVGGWLGGHLAYTYGVGVDTNAFETGPQEWTPATGKIPSDGSLGEVVADGVRIVVTRTEQGVRALADRCSHRGGPLSDGERVAHCVKCPWHGSEFDLDSGIALKGPASIAQPVYEIRETDGLEVRRDEPRALRQRAVRPRRPE